MPTRELDSGLTFSAAWRLGVLGVVGWMIWALAQGSSGLAILAVPLLIGLWIYAIVVIDRWAQAGGRKAELEY
jgi:hypothetical protein